MILELPPSTSVIISIGVRLSRRDKIRFVITKNNRGPWQAIASHARTLSIAVHIPRHHLNLHKNKSYFSFKEIFHHVGIREIRFVQGF